MYGAYLHYESESAQYPLDRFDSKTNNIKDYNSNAYLLGLKPHQWIVIIKIKIQSEDVKKTSSI